MMAHAHRDHQGKFHSCWFRRLAQALLVLQFLSLLPQNLLINSVRASATSGNIQVEISGPTVDKREIAANETVTLRFPIKNNANTIAELAADLFVMQVGGLNAERGATARLSLGGKKTGEFVFRVTAPIASGSYAYQLRVRDTKTGASFFYPSDGPKSLFTIRGPLVLTPSRAHVPPRAKLNFKTLGGGSKMIFDLIENNSGGSIDPKSGLYTAGRATDTKVDIVRVKDELGQIAVAMIVVGPHARSTEIIQEVVSLAGNAIEMTDPDLSVSGPDIDKFTVAPGAPLHVAYKITNRVEHERDLSITLRIEKKGSTTSAGREAVRKVRVPGGAVVKVLFDDLLAPADPGEYRWWIVIRDEKSGSRIEFPPKLYRQFDARLPLMVVVPDQSLEIAPKSAEILSADRVRFVGIGGGRNYRYSFARNASGGTLDPETGDYTAGSTAGVADLVRVSDEAGNTAEATVRVSQPLRIKPEEVYVISGKSVVFEASGGFGDLAYSLSVNNSDGRINSSSGEYRAGTRIETTDHVRVTDRAGNFVEAKVIVPGDLDRDGLDDHTEKILGTNPRIADTDGDGVSDGTEVYSTKTDPLKPPATSEPQSPMVTRSDSPTPLTTPVNIAAPSVTGVAATGATLTAAPGTWSGNPNFTYQWYRDGLPITGATSATYRLTDDDAAKTITCRVTATNDGGNAEMMTADVKVKPLPVTNTTAPAITGENTVGSPLVCSPGTWTGGAPPAISFRWLVDGVPIDGAVGDHYTPGARDAGRTITCEVTATGPDGPVAVVTPVGAKIATLSRPVIEPAAVTIDPDEVLQLKLSGGTEPFTWTYEILNKESAGDLELVPNDEGARFTNGGSNIDVHFRILVKDRHGLTGEAAVTVRTPGSPPYNSTPPKITGDPKPGSKLTCDPGAWSGTPAPVFAYQWLLDGVPISGATSASHTIRESDAGKTLTCQVTATNGVGTAVNLTTASGVVAVAPPAPAVTAGPPLKISHATRKVVAGKDAYFWAEGGTPPYVFSLRSAQSQGARIEPLTTTGYAGSQTGGNYTAGSVSAGTATDVIEVRDAAGATVEAIVTVSAPLVLTAPSTSIAAGGSMTVLASGGTPPYTFKLRRNRSGATIDPATGLYTAGPKEKTDILQVMDANEKTAEVSVEVSGPRPPVLQVPDEAFSGEAVTLTVTGGKAPFLFGLVENKSGGTIDAATGRYVPGTTVDVLDVIGVSDANGAVDQRSVVVRNPAAPLKLAQATYRLVSGEQATLIPEGGTGNYTFTLTTNASGATLKDVNQNLKGVRILYTAGTVTTGTVTDIVEVKDGDGKAISATILVAPPVMLSVPVKKVPIGSSPITFAASGGHAPYKYRIMTTPPNGTIDALTGVYTPATAGKSYHDIVTVEDASGHSPGEAVVIHVDAPLVVTPPAASVITNRMGDRIDVAYEVSGGRAPNGIYSVSIKQNQSNGRLPSSGASSEQVNYYHPGNIRSGVADDILEIKDAEGTTVTLTIRVTAYGTEPVASSVPSGGSSSTTPTTPVVTMPAAPLQVFAPATAAVGSERVQVRAVGGTPPYVFSVRAPANGGSIDAASGEYSPGAGSSRNEPIDVVDARGNKASVDIYIYKPLQVLSGKSQRITHYSGSTFSMKANSSGGSVTGDGNYTAGTVSAPVTDVVEVKDRDGRLGTFILSVAPPLSLAAAKPSTGGGVEFKAGGGFPPYTYMILNNTTEATINAATGLYTFGTWESIRPHEDFIKVRDSVGNEHQMKYVDLVRNVLPENALGIMPGSATVEAGATAEITASGGRPPYVFTFVQNTSGGRLENGAGGAMSYAAGDRTGVDRIEVKDADGAVAAAIFTVTGRALAIAPANGSVPSGGQLPFTATGGSPPYKFSIFASSAKGSIDEQTGIYTGGPRGKLNLYDIVMVTDANGATAKTNVTTLPGPSLSPQTLKAMPGQTYSFVADAVGPVTYSIKSNATGGTIDQNGNYKAGSVASGTMTDIIQVKDRTGATGEAVVTVAGPLTLTSPVTDVATKATVPISLTASGGFPPYKFSFDQPGSYGSIEQTGEYRPGGIGGVNDIIVVTDAVGNKARVTIGVIDKPEITSVRASFKAGEAFTFTASGGKGRLTFSLKSNNSGGAIGADGKYTAGNTSVRTSDIVQVKDELGRTAEITVEVNPIIPVTTPASSSSTMGNGGPLTLTPEHSFDVKKNQEVVMTIGGGTGNITVSLAPPVNEGGNLRVSGDKVYFRYTGKATFGDFRFWPVARDGAGNEAKAYIFVNLGSMVETVFGSDAAPTTPQMPSGGPRSPGPTTGATPPAVVNTAPPTISGSTQPGSTLTVQSGEWTGAITFKTQWLRDGSAIAGATGSTYVTTSADAGRTITCMITGANAGGSLDALSSNAIALQTMPSERPRNTSPPSISGDGKVGSTLTCAAGTWTNSPSFTYQWFRDGVAITGATAATYTLTDADASRGITCKVVATNVSGSADATTASSVVAMVISAPPAGATTPAAKPPVNTVKPIITGENVKVLALTLAYSPAIATLKCSPGEWTGDPPITFSYQWFSGSGRPIDGATGSTVNTEGFVGLQLACYVTATNAAGSQGAWTSNQVQPQQPLNILYSGNNSNQDLRATPGYSMRFYASGGIAPYRFSIAENRSGGTVSDATYTAGRPKTEVTDIVRVTDDVGATADAAVVVYALKPPENVVPPSIGQNILADNSGSTLSVTDGTWRHASSYRYQWLLDGEPLPNQTNRNFRITQAESGRTLTCVVTAIGGEGTTEMVTPVGYNVPGVKQLPGPPVNTMAPAIFGPTPVGSTLTCNRGQWTGFPEPVITFQWFVDGSPITGATGSTYVVQESHNLKTITCEVTAANASGKVSLITTGMKVGSIPLTISPASRAVMPGTNRQAFAIEGGKSPYTVKMQANPSGGSVSYGGAGGATYAAGNTGGVTDIIRVTDANGTFSDATVNVLKPLVNTTPFPVPPVNNNASSPRGIYSGAVVELSATGGLAPYTFTMPSSPSGSTISGTTFKAGENMTAASVNEKIKVTDSLGNAIEVTVAVYQRPPKNATPPVITGTGLAEDELKCGPGEWSAQSTPNLTYRWFKDGVQTNEQNAVFKPTRQDVGKTFTCRVNAWTPAGSDSAFSSPITIRAKPLTISPTTATCTGVGGRQDFTIQGGDLSKGPLALTFVTNNSGATFVANYGNAIYRAGSKMQVTDVVQVSDGTQSVTATVTVNAALESPRFTAAPVIKGEAAPGKTLECTSPGTWAGFPVPSLSYQWLLNNAPITGATSSTYVLPAEAAGAYSCRVTGLNSVGSNTAASNAITVVGPPIISLATSPALTGPMWRAPGLTATASVTPGSGLPPYTFTIPDNKSGGTIAQLHMLSAKYTAGATTGVTDVVRVTDASGRYSEMAVDVVSAPTISAPLSKLEPGQSMKLTVSGGKPPYTFKFTTPINEYIASNAKSSVSADHIYTAGIGGPGSLSIARTEEKIIVMDQLGLTASTVVTINEGGLPTVNYATPPVIVDGKGLRSYGATLTCDPGKWKGSTSTFSYQWYKNGVPVPGATASTIKVDEAVYGPYQRLGYTCEVRAANAFLAQPHDFYGRHMTGEALIFQVNPNSAQIEVGGTRSFTTMNMGKFTWTVVDKPSGGSFSGTPTGTWATYQAGTKPNVTDKIKVTNENGDVAFALISVLPAFKIPTNSAAPKITGTVGIGKPLKCDTGTWSAIPAATYTYQWYRKDGGAIPDATQPMYTPVLPGDANSVIYCEVTATNVKGTATASATGVTVPYEKPINLPDGGGAPAITGTPKVGSELACNPGKWTGNQPISFTYQWVRGGADIPGATLDRYTVAMSDTGQLLECRVTATNSKGFEKASTNSVRVEVPRRPVNTSIPIISGMSKVGSVLTTSPGTWIGAPEISYQWLRNGQPINGATTPTYTTTSADLGSKVTCAVIALNVVGSEIASGEPRAIVETPFPVNTQKPTISGDPKYKAILTVDPGKWTGDPTFTYQWVRADRPIPGATGQTYVVDGPDVDKAVRCGVTGTNAGGSLTETSASLTIINTEPPVNTKKPVITGVSGVGMKINTSMGEWNFTGGAPVSLILEWLRDGQPMGVLTPYYTLTAQDVGKSISTRATFTNKFGSATATSDPVTVWAKLNTTEPKISGTPRVGQILTCNPGTWPAGATLTYQWYWGMDDWRNLIPGATAATYSPVWPDGANFWVDNTTMKVICEVTATVGEKVGAATAFVPMTFKRPVNSGAKPSITGTAKVGATLTCNPGVWTGDPAITYTYQWVWYRDYTNFTDIPGATSSTYTPAVKEGVQRIGCNVIAWASGPSKPVAAVKSGSSDLFVEVQQPLANTIPPKIVPGPSLRIGEDVDVNPGEWTGSTRPSYKIQWMRGGVAITGATDWNYILVAADAGKNLTCKITASRGGEVVSVTTPPLFIPLPAPPVNTVLPAIVGDPEAGKMLSCTKGTWTSGTDIEYSFQWYLGGAKIEGANSQMYTTSLAQKDKLLTCKVKATNWEGSKEVATVPVKVAGPRPIEIFPTTIQMGQYQKTHFKVLYAEGKPFGGDYKVSATGSAGGAYKTSIDVIAYMSGFSLGTDRITVSDANGTSATVTISVELDIPAPYSEEIEKARRLLSGEMSNEEMFKEGMLLALDQSIDGFGTAMQVAKIGKGIKDAVDGSKQFSDFGGTIIQGPYRKGSIVTATNLSNPDSVVVGEVLDDMGTYFLRVPWVGPTRISAEGEFFDEFIGTPANLGGPLTAVTTGSDSILTLCSINIPTAIVENVLKNSPDTLVDTMAVRSANQKVKAALGVWGDSDISEIPLGEPNRNAMALRSFHLAVAAEAGPNRVLEAIEQLASEISANRPLGSSAKGVITDTGLRDGLAAILFNDTIVARTATGDTIAVPLTLVFQRIADIVSLETIRKNPATSAGLDTHSQAVVSGSIEWTTSLGPKAATLTEGSHETVYAFPGAEAGTVTKIEVPPGYEAIVEYE